MKPKSVSIGAAARKAGCSVPAVRHYEEAGLIAPLGRAANGRRVFTPNEVRRLVFIRRCRDFGFSLDDIRALIAAMDRPDCFEARDVLRAQIAAIKARRAELERLEASLVAAESGCTDACKTKPASACEMLGALGV